MWMNGNSIKKYVASFFSFEFELVKKLFLVREQFDASTRSSTFTKYIPFDKFPRV